MHIADYAKTRPDHPAYIMADTGQATSYLELNNASNQGAQLFRSLGLVAGDHIAIFMENNQRLLEIVWAAQRSGLIYTLISTHLQREEVSFIASDCNARLFITSAMLSEVAGNVRKTLNGPEHFYMVDAALNDFESWEQAVAGMSTEAVADEERGAAMLYSSGTTGMPKGILPSREAGVAIGEISPVMQAMAMGFGIDENTVYLSPAPLYHAAPLVYNMLTMFSGGTSIIMSSFDALNSLALIERHKATHSQWVPIMFVRMLKMPEAERMVYDVSSMKVAIHAAAPCPVEIKKQMIDWWGPVIYEYYAATEGHGITLLNSEQWLAHPGSVGAAAGCTVHILDEEGNEQSAGEVGTVYFESDSAPFEYYNAPEKTAEAFSKQGYATVGDVGYLDEDGFLYLTDRAHFMIISGGVNIYPQEVENLLITHPKVADAAVFGIPSEAFGEEVKAVIQPLEGVAPDDQLATELMVYCRDNLSHIKCPKSIDFLAELPRLDNGKLYKRRLVESYK